MKLFASTYDFVFEMKNNMKSNASHSVGALLLSLAGLLAGCTSGSSDPMDSNTPVRTTAAMQTDGISPTRPSNLDLSCDDAPFPSARWTQCEIQNFAKTTEALREQLQPAFIARSLTQSASNFQAWLARGQNDPSWLVSGALNAPLLPACATGQGPCLGDPFAYPEVNGPDGRTFYENEATVTPVVFYDRDCTRLSGQVWLPRASPANTKLAHIVFANGSVQAPQPTYRPFIQAYVRAGYAVLSYDPRGQGQSDQQSPNFKQGSNLGPEVFWENLVDAIDFMHSNPTTPHPHDATCKGTYPTRMSSFNPGWQKIDTARLGIAGHSLGAMGVSVVQGYGAKGADPWPGKLSKTNPVKAAVALDSLITPDGSGLMPINCFMSGELAKLLSAQVIALGRLPKFGIRVPSLSFSGDYCGVPAPYVTPPDAEFSKTAFKKWQTEGVATYTLTFQGTTHFDFSPTPILPATSWCADTSANACRGGWAIPAINYYSIAWFDRWLKNPGEKGFDDADQRLVNDAGPQGAVKMSFHKHSARDFTDRNGKRQRCENIRKGCTAG